MTKRRSWAVVAVAVAIAWLSGRPAGAQTIDPAFEADLKALMEITGAAAIGTQMASLTAEQFLNALRKAQPQIPERASEIIKETLNEEFAKAFTAPDGLMPQLIAMYAKHFTREDVAGLLTFYRSDLGKKVVATLPGLMREGAAAGNAWMATRIGPMTALLQERLKAEGLIK